MAKKSYVIDIMQPVYPFGVERVVDKSAPSGRAINIDSMSSGIKALDIANVLPTTEGYSSFFGKSKLGIPGLSRMSEKVFTYRDAIGNNTLVALGKYGALLSKDGVTLDSSELWKAIPQLGTGNYKVVFDTKLTYVGFANCEAIITKPAITTNTIQFGASSVAPQPNNPKHNITIVPLDAVGARYQSKSTKLEHDEAMEYNRVVEYIDPGLVSITAGNHYCLYTPFNYALHTAAIGETVRDVLLALISVYNGNALVSQVAYESDNRLRNIALSSYSTTYVEPIRCMEVPATLPTGTLLYTLQNDQIPQRIPKASQGNLGYGIFRSASPLYSTHAYNIRRSGYYQVGGTYLPNGVVSGIDGSLTGADLNLILDTPFAIPLEYADYMLRQYSGLHDNGLTLEIYDTGLPLQTKPLGSRSMQSLQGIVPNIGTANISNVTAVMQTLGQLGSHTQVLSTAAGNVNYSALQAYNAAGTAVMSLQGNGELYATTAPEPLQFQLSAQPVVTLGANVLTIKADSFQMISKTITNTLIHKLYNLSFTMLAQTSGLLYTLYNDNEPVLITDPNGAWTDANYQFTSAQLAAAVTASTPLVARLTGARLNVIATRADGTYPSIPAVPARGTSIATATPIVLNQSIYADIVNPGDSNYFSITPATTGSYIMESTGGLDSYGSLYDAAGVLLAANDDGGASTNFKITHTLTAGVTYYLQARLFSSTNTGAYTVTASLVGSLIQALPGTAGNIDINFHTMTAGLGSDMSYHALDNTQYVRAYTTPVYEVYTSVDGIPGFYKLPNNSVLHYTELDTRVTSIPTTPMVAPTVVDKFQFIAPVDITGKAMFTFQDLDTPYEDYGVTLQLLPLGAAYPFAAGITVGTPLGQSAMVTKYSNPTAAQIAELELVNPWTVAVLNNSLYCYRQGLGYILHFLAATSTWERLTPTFVNLPQIQGISTARGRLMMWDSANAVYTSSVSNAMDFTPSVSTKANVTKINSLIGDIITTLPLKEGYVIYSSSSIILATYVGGTVNYKYTVLSQSQGILNALVVTIASETDHYAYTNVGLVKVTAAGLTPVSFAADSYIKQSNISPRLDFLSGRYLSIALAPQQSAQKVTKVEPYRGAVINGKQAIPGTPDKIMPAVVVPDLIIPGIPAIAGSTVADKVVLPIVVGGINSTADKVIAPIVVANTTVPDKIVDPIVVPGNSGGVDIVVAPVVVGGTVVADKVIASNTVAATIIDAKVVAPIVTIAKVVAPIVVPATAAGQDIIIPPRPIPGIAITNPDIVIPDVIVPGISSSSTTITIPPVIIPGVSVKDSFIPPTQSYKELATKGTPASSPIIWDVSYQAFKSYVIPGYSATWEELSFSWGGAVINTGTYYRPDFVINSTYDLLDYGKWLRDQSFHPSNVVGNGAYYYAEDSDGLLIGAPATDWPHYRADAVFFNSPHVFIRTTSVTFSTTPQGTPEITMTANIQDSVSDQTVKTRRIMESELEAFLVREYHNSPRTKPLSISHRELPMTFVKGLSPVALGVLSISGPSITAPPIYTKTFNGVGNPPEKAATPDVYITVSGTPGTTIPGYTIPDVIIPGYDITVTTPITGGTVIPGYTIKGSDLILGKGTIPGYTIPGTAGTPEYTIPGYTVPEYTIPGYTIPGYTIPGYIIPGYTIPGYTTVGYTIPGYTIPGINSASGYTIPGYVIPGYTVLGYTIQGYTISGTPAIPAYTIPGYTILGYSIPGLAAIPKAVIPGYTIPSYTIYGEPGVAAIPDLVIPGGSYIGASGSNQPANPIYYRSLLFDTKLVNWGSYDESHSMLWDFSPINLRTYNPITGVTKTKFDTQNMALSIGILDISGNLFQATDNNPLARLEFGDVGFTRSGVTRLLTAEAHFVTETGAYLEVWGSTDGALLSRSLRAAKLSQNGSVILNTVLTGKWFRLIVHGRFNIKSLTFSGIAGGNR